MVVYYPVTDVWITSTSEVKPIMKEILVTLMLLVVPMWATSCATIDGPAEPASTDTLEDRVEPPSLDSKYNPEIEEEIETDEAPLATEEMEDQPLIK